MEYIYPILPHLATIVGFLLAVVLLGHMLTQKRSPFGTLAWVLVIVLIPYIGVPLYLLIGGRKMRRQSRSKGDLFVRSRRRVIPEDQADPLDQLLRSFQLPGATEGNRVELCGTGEQTYRRLVAMIDQARTSIYIATYVFKLDAVGRDILDRLIARARDGVDVRLLVDGVGSHGVKARHLKPLRQAGGQAAHFNSIFYKPLRNRLDLRNHRKIVIVDHQTVLAGGTNIASEYIGPAESDDRWRDLAFVLQGPEVRVYEEIFAQDWAFTTDSEVPDRPADPLDESPSDGQIVQTVPSGPDVPGDGLFQAITSVCYFAKKRLWVATPYFVPDEPLLQALTLAAHRKVDVRLVIPRKSNQRLTNWARGPYLREMHQAGVSIYLYEPGMMHAKVLACDDRLAVIGSANMDFRSFFLNYEVATFVYSQPIIEQTADWIAEMMEQSTTAEPKSGRWRQLGEGMARLLAPLL